MSPMNVTLKAGVSNYWTFSLEETFLLTLSFHFENVALSLWQCDEYRSRKAKSLRKTLINHRSLTSFSCVSRSFIFRSMSFESCRFKLHEILVTREKYRQSIIVLISCVTCFTLLSASSSCFSTDEFF